MFRQISFHQKQVETSMALSNSSAVGCVQIVNTHTFQMSPKPTESWVPEILQYVVSTMFCTVCQESEPQFVKNPNQLVKEF